MMEALTMILLTVPVPFPIVLPLDLGMEEDRVAVSFGIRASTTFEVGMVTPPFVLNIFFVNAIARWGDGGNLSPRADMWRQRHRADFDNLVRALDRGSGFRTLV